MFSFAIKYHFNEAWRKKEKRKKVLEVPLTLTGCITVHCIRFVFGLYG